MSWLTGLRATNKKAWIHRGAWARYTFFCFVVIHSAVFAFLSTETNKWIIQFEAPTIEQTVNMNLVNHEKIMKIFAAVAWAPYRKPAHHQRSLQASYRCIKPFLLNQEADRIRNRTWWWCIIKLNISLFLHTALLHVASCDISIRRLIIVCDLGTYEYTLFEMYIFFSTPPSHQQRTPL